jgi:hypothetical protein
MLRRASPRGLPTTAAAPPTGPEWCRMTDDAELADGAGEARQAGLIAQNARSCKMHDWLGH